MFYFGTSLAWLVFKKADLCLPVKQLTVQTQGEDAGKVFLKFRTQQSQFPQLHHSSSDGKCSVCDAYKLLFASVSPGERIGSNLYGFIPN